MKYETRADLLIAVGESIKMQIAAGAIPKMKHRGNMAHIENIAFIAAPSEYELPLAVVEGKPVFIGDELYCKYPGCLTCTDTGVSKFKATEGDDYEFASWNPPKPKTVMVELLREDAEYIIKITKKRPTEKYVIDRVGAACRQALNEEGSEA